jgi:hypothetical protein
MTGHDLLNNCIKNPEALLRKKQSCAASSTTPPTDKLVTPAPSATPIMAKTIRDYSVPAVANVPTAVNTRNGNFELRTGLIMSHPKFLF